MTNHRDRVLNFLQRHAALAPLSECLNLADEVQRLNDNEYYLKCILTILSSILLTKDGAAKTQATFDNRRSLQIALKELQQCHAWVVCGPVTDGLEKLLCEFDKK